MRRRVLTIGLPIAGLAAVAVYAGWAFYSDFRSGGGWSSLHQAWPYLLAGMLTAAAVIALFVWLAIYSDRRGYDQRVGIDKR